MHLAPYFFFSLLLSFLSACSTSTQHMEIYRDGNKIPKDFPSDGLSIEYLGVGGHLFRFEGSAIMTAPSITNPSFWLLGPFMPISSDSDLIDRYLPDVSDVESILIGHAHYDHLMDVPYIMQEKAPLAHAFGSNTMKHSIAPAINNERLHGLNDSMAIKKQPGTWQYNDKRNIRFMALKSTHAPHFMGINIMTGSYDEDLDSLPWHAFGWKEGQTLSYIIDFLGAEEEILHRVYYQDAASQEPLGLLPDFVEKDQKRVDISIITPASFSQVDNYPESIMQDTQARHYILGHWEDFFANQEQKQQDFVRAIDADEFFRRFTASLNSDSSWTMPMLYQTQYFALTAKY